MLAAIRAWLEPPVFPEDLNKTRVAKTLNAILLVSLGGSLVYILFILIIARGEFKSLLFSVIPLIFILALRYMMRKGFIVSISLVFVFLSWLNLTVAAVVDGYGIRGTSLYGYVLIVIVAGLLIHWKAAVGFSLLNLLSGLGLIYADEIGALPPHSALQTDFTIWSANAVFSISAAFVLGITLRILNETFRNASLQETYYRMLFEEAPNGIMIVDRHNKITMANAAVYQMTGYTPEEVIGRSPNDFVAPEDIARRPLRQISEFQVSGSMKHERVIVCKDQSRLNVVIGSSFMPDGYLQYIIQDITDRKKMEDALRASEEKFAKSFQSSPDAVTISSIATGKFIDVNDGFCQMSGYAREEALGRSAEDLHIWDDIAHRKLMVEILQRDNRVRDFATILHRRSGEPLSCLLSVEVIEIGGEKCMVAITRDVTHHKRIEAELRVSEERYRMVSSVISDYTFFTRVDEVGNLHMVWTTGAFEKITGYKPGEFEAQGGWVSTLHPDDISQDEHDMAVLRSNQRVVTEIRTIRKNSDICWVRCYAHPVWDDEENRLVGIYGAVQDITEHKRIESERENLIRELEAKNIELEQFTYMVSHDLKAPIITIKGFLGYLSEDVLSGNMQRMEKDMQRIGEAADKMHKLLNDLLELSRVGRLINTSEPIDVYELILEVERILQGSLEKQAATLRAKTPLPLVYGDRQRLFEVFQNLLENASKFMGNQPNPLIEIGQQGEAQSGLVTLYVRDNGIGIAPQFHERIFGLFNRLNPKVEGTGVGLALVKRIIEFHGGQIWVESEPERGTTFFFTLPQA